MAATSTTAQAVVGGPSRKARRISGGSTANITGADVWVKTHSVTPPTSTSRAAASVIVAWASSLKR